MKAPDKYLLALADGLEKCKRCQFWKSGHCFYGLNQRPRFMIIMQNPGSPKNTRKLDEEIRLLGKAKTSKAKILIWQKFLKEWILDENRKFFSNFFKEMRQLKLVKFSELDSYVTSNRIFNDFHFTDAVKCRARTEDLQKDKNSFCKCFDSFLREEIDYLKPRLIFAFSTRTWAILRDRMKLEPVAPVQRWSLAQSHGRLFKYGRNQFVMPLAHMSKKMLNFYLRDSYFTFFNEGLKGYVSETQ